jgi:hypothetical protein
MHWVVQDEGSAGQAKPSKEQVQEGMKQGVRQAEEQTPGRQPIPEVASHLTEVKRKAMA